MSSATLWLIGLKTQRIQTMRMAIAENSITMGVGVMDACTEPMDPSDGMVQAEMARIGELSPEERDVEYHDIGRACFELCGAGNVIYLDLEIARARCFNARVTRAALVSSGVYVEAGDDILGADELDRIPDLQVKIVD